MFKQSDLLIEPDIKAPHSPSSAKNEILPLSPNTERACIQLQPNASSLLEERYKESSSSPTAALKPGRPVKGHFHPAAQGGRSHPSCRPLAQITGRGARSPRLGLVVGRYHARRPRAGSDQPPGAVPALPTAPSCGLLRPQRAWPGHGPGLLRPACQTIPA